MKNIVKTVPACVGLALPVPDPTLSGDVRVLGAGLTVIALTDRATTATIASGFAAPGLQDGEASCRVINVSNVVVLALDGAIAQFVKVYVTGTGTYTATAAGNKFIGYSLNTLAAAGPARVALTNA